MIWKSEFCNSQKWRTHYMLKKFTLSLGRIGIKNWLAAEKTHRVLNRAQGEGRMILKGLNLSVQTGWAKETRNGKLCYLLIYFPFTLLSGSRKYQNVPFLGSCNPWSHVADCSTLVLAEGTIPLLLHGLQPNKAFCFPCSVLNREEQLFFCVLFLNWRNHSERQSTPIPGM